MNNAPKPQNEGMPTMTTPPEPRTPNAGNPKMKTPHPTDVHPSAIPEKDPRAEVVQIRVTTFNVDSGRTHGVWSIKNPDGSFWSNRRGRRRAWGTRSAAEGSRYRELSREGKIAPIPGIRIAADEVGPPPSRIVDQKGSRLKSIEPAPRTGAILSRVESVDGPAAVLPRSSHPDGDRIGKLVAAAIAIDHRIAPEIMRVISESFRDA